MYRCFVFLCFLLAGSLAWCRTRLPLSPVPGEVASTHFTVTIDGQLTPVYHAAMNLYFLNFEVRRHTTISVTADADDFWKSGVEVQPWRLGIRPERHGRTITFRLDGSGQISISRPGDYLGDAEMLYLFANPSEKVQPIFSAPGLRYIGPGIHRENIDALAGEQIYLAPGAVVFGSLNIWGVDHVRVFGRGVIVYDGPQSPASDDGWMHKPNWHCIVMDNAHDISIEGITCVVRSRTWQIQMKDSRDITFDNIKVIGANAGNANADGMDWLGGGDTIVRNSFFRAADDVFAMQTSWEGYGSRAFAVQGSPVTNVKVENTVVSTSISNIVRAGWPEKNFEGGNFEMRDSDVLHMGLGGCGVPFALMELWADPAGRGESAGFHFQNVRLEDWYSLVELRQPTPGVKDVTFRDIAALELPSRVPSVISGQVEGVRFDNIVTSGVFASDEASLPLERKEGAPATSIAQTGPKVHIVSAGGLVRPGQKIHLEAVVESVDRSKLQFQWTFGDGSHAHGARVKHRFADDAGTLLDGSGRYRVLLHVSAPGDRHTWLYEPVIVANSLLAAQTLAAQTLAAPGLTVQPGDQGSPGVRYGYSELDQEDGVTSEQSGVIPTFALPLMHRKEHYALSLEGTIQAPVDGTYAFLIFANDQASIVLDGKRTSTAPKPFAQVCGLAGNATRAVTLYAALAKGLHHIEITEAHQAGEDHFQVLWRTPGRSFQAIDAGSLTHATP